MAGATDAMKFADKTKRYATAWQRANRDAVSRAALTIKGSVMTQIARTTGGSMKLSGVGKKGSKVGVRYNVRGYYGNVTAIVSATGALHLLERDTKAHEIPRGFGSRRTRTSAGRLSAKRVSTSRSLDQARPMKIGGEWRTGPFKHPGTKGQKPFELGVRTATPIVDRVMRQAHTSSLARTFGVGG